MASRLSKSNSPWWSRSLSQVWLNHGGFSDRLPVETLQAFILSLCYFPAWHYTETSKATTSKQTTNKLLCLSSVASYSFSEVQSSNSPHQLIIRLRPRRRFGRETTGNRTWFYALVFRYSCEIRSEASNSGLSVTTKRRFTSIWNIPHSLQQF